MSLPVFLSGASGFVGRSVLATLLDRGHHVHALIHRNALPLTDDRIRVFGGGMFDASALDQAMSGCGAAIHLVGIIAEDPSAGVTFDRIHRQGSRCIVDAAQRNGVKRYIHMSAAGARADAVARYHQTKFAAETIVRSSGLQWTIFQPSLIHGPDGEFMKMELDWIHHKAMPYVAMPYFGGGLLGMGGGGSLQPIHVTDVARAFAQAIDTPASIGKTYGLGGAQRVSWPQLHRHIARHFIGRARMTLAIPVWLARTLTHVLPRRALPFNEDQVLMSQEDNGVDMSAFVADFGWRPRGLDQALAEYPQSS